MKNRTNSDFIARNEARWAAIREKEGVRKRKNGKDLSPVDEEAAKPKQQKTATPRRVPALRPPKAPPPLLKTRRKAKDDEERKRWVQEAQTRSTLRYAATKPGKTAAHRMVSRAIKHGLLVPTPCRLCGKANRIEAHHSDYAKPLDVTWLCRPCHKKVHKFLTLPDPINEAKKNDLFAGL